VEEDMTGVRFEARKAMAVAYIEHLGPYDRIPWEEYIERLYAWAKSQKVMPGFHAMGIYWDDPKATQPEQCRSRVAISYKGLAREKDGVRIDKLPEMTVATLSHKGPASDIASSYAEIAGFITKSGRRPSGAPIEVYSKKPEVVGGQTILYCKIMVPVK